MEEILDILDKDGNKTGKSLSKKEIHKQGFRHATAHIWIYNSKGEILLQKRSFQKSSHPGERDISAAGHISSGEDIITGALRELEEEVGIKANPEDLKEIGTWKNTVENTTLNKEYDTIYLYKYDGDIHQLHMQPEEVDELKFISLEEFKSKANNPHINNYVEHKPEYFNIIITALENIIS